MTILFNQDFLQHHVDDLSFLLTQVMQGVSMLNEDGTYAYLNPAYANPFGYQVEELLGKNWAITVLPEDIRIVLDAYKLMQKEGRAEAEVRAKRKNGSIFWKHIIMIKPRDQHGSFNGHYCFMTDISERKYLEAQLRDMANKDELTKLYNRRGLIQLAEQKMSDQARKLKKMKLFIFDMDGLKQINDSYGHVQGDQALIEFAHVLVKCFNNEDIVARLGGDEFVVLCLNDVNEEMMRSRLQNACEDAKLNLGHDWDLAFSMGHVYIPPLGQETIEQLLDEADTKMYQCKAAKRSTR